MTVTSVERVPWETFVAERFPWRQGEHVAIIGPTGRGKTTLAQALLPLRSFVIVLGTKPRRDATLTAWSRLPGWRTISKADDIPRAHGRPELRVLLWVKFKTEEDEDRQRFQLWKAMTDAFAAGNWTIYIDEIWYAEDVLRLAKKIRILLTQGRSEGITVVGGSQRPAFIQRIWYDQPTHLFFARDNDHDNLKRISGLNGVNSKIVRETVATLDRFEWLYVNTVEGFMFVTRPPKA